MKNILRRCPWPIADDELYVKYHDEEWGVPVYEDRKIFEFLILESFQAGLSWRTVLHKRENFRHAFIGFDYRKVARFTAADQARLILDAGIIRNRAKIQAAIINAQCFLQVQKEFGTFSKYMWSWVDGKPRINKFKSSRDYVATSDEAIAWAKDLKQRGFKFLGPTVVYAHMQAVGMVNDHTMDCFRYRQVNNCG
ncbi:MAG: DNA-3-methyladenine glycosylase I [Candidatus Omnitrophica bacterium]|nr:DNA-3-methyladenine glycosylase I [Candidatus Omnitrophota bacterium]